jgi:class 3 adenylate cyclase/tetratricopeptide (TPR) repeat protein
MKCRNCQFENPAGMRFCGECGTEMGLVCPNCKAINPPQFKFCGECGNALTSQTKSGPVKELSLDEQLANIQKYLPSSLTKKILSEKKRMEGERRHVTIMFVDMKGFTPLSETLGPEETFSLMDQVFQILLRQIHDYEGTVNELRGDGVLALFGAPIALEDAPQRAIRSALAIHKDMAKFSEKIKAEKEIPPIWLRIGINSGPVVVGTVGDDFRVQFTAVGDTINMAARMEQLAEPGTTYVTEETFRLTEGFFRFEALGEKEIKGKENPAKVYRVIAPSTRRTRFDVSAERGLTRFVGRQRELETMLESFQRAKAGQGQACFVMGEAGIGKSRLLYEFRKAVANEDVTFLEGRCLTYSRGVAYYPIIEVVKSNFRVGDRDTNSDITEKVERGLTTLGIDTASTLPYLLELMSVRSTSLESIRMSPQAMKDRILESLRLLVLKGSEKKPLILALEDMHLMDKSSEESAKYLLESIPGARVMMIFTFRPEFVHTWPHRSFHCHVTLNRLSSQESLAMTEHIMGGAAAPDLQELILEKTEGAPFFIEEFVRTLSQMAAIEPPNQAYHLAKDIDSVAIPSTIQDVILSRVDSLPEAAKEVLQTGSAIEKEFGYELIKAVTDLPEQELLSHLSVLRDAELLYERGIFPQSTYVFKSAITRDVVYDAILNNRKKLLHQKIGKAIEELYRDSLDVYHSVLADHFMVAEDFEKSAEYSRLTYERARLQAAFATAISYAQKRIKALEHLPLTEEVQPQLIDARVWLGLTLFTAGHVPEAKKAIEPIVEITLRSNDKKRLTEIYFILGGYQYSVEENVAQGLELLEDAVQNAEDTTDARSASLAHFYYGECLCLNCQFESGAESIRKAISIQESVQNLWAVSTLYSHLSHYAYNYQGKVEEGFAASLKAMELAESSGDIHSRAHAYVCHGVSCFYKGFFTAAEQHLLQGIDLYEHMPVPAIGHQGLGYIYFEKGEFKKSRAHFRKAILFRELTGLLPSCVNLNKVALARSDLADGKTDLDVQSLVQLVRYTKSKLYYGTMARHLAEILFHQGEAHFKEAESWLQTAILNHEEGGMKWDLASDYVALAQFRKLQGWRGEEKDYLTEALLLFSKCGAEGWSRRIETGVAQE